MKLFKKVGSPAKSWITPKAKRGVPSKIAGYGLFADQLIKKDELIVVKAGRIIDKDTLLKNESMIKGSEAQIYDDLYIAPLTEQEYEASMGYVNHSCEPNAGFGGNVLVVAMRDIMPGEEITLDYAMMRTDEDYRLICNCQTESCRQTIIGNDWEDKGLQKKYAGYFQWYIERKIKQSANT